MDKVAMEVLKDGAQPRHSGRHSCADPQVGPRLAAWNEQCQAKAGGPCIAPAVSLPVNVTLQVSDQQYAVSLCIARSCASACMCYMGAFRAFVQV